jgi:hypothetical protein
MIRIRAVSGAREYSGAEEGGEISSSPLRGRGAMPPPWAAGLDAFEVVFIDDNRYAPS